MYGTAQASNSGLAGNPSRLTQVQEQMQRSGKIVGSIEEKMKSLYDRLMPVLGNSVPESKDGQSVPKPTLVGHANALSNHNDQLENFSGMLGDILDRLEL